MNNAKAVAGSAAMVMIAALGTGGLLAWQAGAAETVHAPMPAAAESEVVIEYVEAPLPETESADQRDAEVVPTDPASTAEESEAHDEYEDDEGEGEGESHEEYEDEDDEEYEDD